MADITIETAVSGLQAGHSVRVGPVWIDVNTAYVFYTVNPTLPEFVYRKTTDGGLTWSDAVVITSDATGCASIWYDRWTPGNEGTLIHIVYLSTDSADVFYRSLDTIDDTLSTEVTVFDGASFSAPGWNTSIVDIVVARGGNLYIGYWGDASGEFGFYRSTDEGDNWTSRAQLADGNAVDVILLMPGDEADDDDIWCVYWDRSADELSLKVYDNSGNSWSETLIAASMDEGTIYFQMSAAPRHKDNHIILAAWNKRTQATANLKAWDIGGSGSIVSLTNVVSNLDDSAEVAVLINQRNDDIYVAYLKGGSWFATVDAVYKKSTDGGTTWDSEQAYSEAAADDLRTIHAGVSVGLGGGRFQPSFYNTDLADLFVNPTNSVSIFPVLPLRAAHVGASVDAVPSQGSARS